MSDQKKKATELSKCRTCSAEIFWTITAKNQKRMPVDAKPVPDGKFILMHRPAENVLYAHIVTSPEEAEGRNRYTSHFSTCPDAKDHRKAK